MKICGISHPGTLREGKGWGHGPMTEEHLRVLQKTNKNKKNHYRYIQMAEDTQ